MATRSGNGRRRLAAVVVAASSALLVAPAAHAEVSTSHAVHRTGAGPCALPRPAEESIQDYSKDLIRCAAAQWPVPGGAARAICVARRESGLVPTTSSPGGAYVGLFQHLASAWQERYQEWADPGWGLKDDPLNGRTNTIVTIRMVNADGWAPWSGTGC